MTTGIRARCEAVVGPRVAGLAVTASAIGAAALAAGILFGYAPAALGVLAAVWLFLAGLAAGGLAFSATIRCSRGRWAVGVLPAVEAGAGFFPAALVLLAVLEFGARGWIPGAAAAGWQPWVLRSSRDLVATAVLFAIGLLYLRRTRAEKEIVPSLAAVSYLLVYVAVLSLWAIDLVMDLHEWAPSTVIPPFVFIGAFLGALAAGTLAVTLGRKTAAHASGDLGKLLFAMVIFWGYLLWSAYLPVWYGNMPDETGQLIARWDGDWKLLTVAVLAAVLVFPFFFLLPERTKRGRASLAAVSISILAGRLGECFLLVLPSLDLRADPASVLLGAGVTVGALGLFVFTVGARLGADRAPADRQA